MADVLSAARQAAAWHGGKEAEVAADLVRLRASGANSVLIDEAVRLLAHHRDERGRIESGLAALGALPRAAE
jgi:hypothetical protein